MDNACLDFYCYYSELQKERKLFQHFKLLKFVSESERQRAGQGQCHKLETQPSSPT